MSVLPGNRKPKKQPLKQPSQWLETLDSEDNTLYDIPANPDSLSPLEAATLLGISERELSERTSTWAL